MNLELMTQTLRWTFWSLLYLGVAFFALLICLGSMSPYLPLWARWGAFAVFAAGIAVDVHTKTRRHDPKGPPVDGERVRVPRGR